MAVSGRVPLLALIYARAAGCLVHRVQDRGPVLGEEVTVNVLGRLDPAVPHLVGFPPSPSRAASPATPRPSCSRPSPHEHWRASVRPPRQQHRPWPVTRWVHIYDAPGWLRGMGQLAGTIIRRTTFSWGAFAETVRTTHPPLGWTSSVPGATGA